MLSRQDTGSHYWKLHLDGAESSNALRSVHEFKSASGGTLDSKGIHRRTVWVTCSRRIMNTSSCLPIPSWVRIYKTRLMGYLRCSRRSISYFPRDFPDITLSICDEIHKYRAFLELRSNGVKFMPGQVSRMRTNL